MQRKTDWVIVLSWMMIIISQLMLYGYILAKSLGWINTPVWVSFIPHLSGGIAVLAIAFQAEKILQRIDYVEIRALAIEQDVKEIHREAGSIKTDLEVIKTKLVNHEARLMKLE